MKYKILEFGQKGNSPLYYDDVEKAIQEHLDAGWELAGSLVVFPQDENYYNAVVWQPMIKKDNPV